MKEIDIAGDKFVFFETEEDGDEWLKMYTDEHNKQDNHWVGPGWYNCKVYSYGYWYGEIVPAQEWISEMRDKIDLLQIKINTVSDFLKKDQNENNQKK